MASDSEAQETLPDGDPPPQGLSLLVTAEGLHETFPLPDLGEVTLGRASTTSVSRRHAVLRVARGLEIEDLRSANGIRVCGRTVDEGRSVRVQVGDIIELGKVMNESIHTQRLPRVEREEVLHEELDALERNRVLDALSRCAGNQTKAARMLGLSRGTLIARLNAFGITRPRKPSTP